MNENKDFSEDDLFVAIKDLLKNTGHLDKLRAEVRAKVTEVLRDRQLSMHSGDKINGPPVPTDEVLLINELIREYLEWNGYLYTASIMDSEASMPQEKKHREDLCIEIGVKDDKKSSALPLLTNIIAAYTERIKRKMNKNKREMY